MTSRIRRLKTLLRRLLRLAQDAETPVHFSKFISARQSAVSAEFPYCPVTAGQPLPIPPRGLWLGYGQTPEEYVASGETDTRRMAELLAPHGLALHQPARPVLDLGCGGGRMIRHLRAAAEAGEVWGMDISGPHIAWLKTHLAPPFRFAVNTTLPHLPFGDGYFGLVYCGSVFTHIDDLAEAWFLEVRRVLAPNGILYCTLHDEHTRERLLAQPDYSLARSLAGHAYMRPGSTVADIMTFGQTHDSNVFYHSRYLRAALEPLFEILSVVPGAYGYQTAWILRRRPSAR